MLESKYIQNYDNFTNWIKSSYGHTLAQLPRYIGYLPSVDNTIWIQHGNNFENKDGA